MTQNNEKAPEQGGEKGNDIMRLFNQFKLGNALYTGNFIQDRMDAERAKLPIEEIERRNIRKMVDDLSNLIISNNNSAIIKSETETHFKYTCQLLVLKLEDFKTIVEAAIQMMPDEVIKKLKPTL